MIKRVNERPAMRETCLPSREPDLRDPGSGLLEVVGSPEVKDPSLLDPAQEANASILVLGGAAERVRSTSYRMVRSSAPRVYGNNRLAGVVGCWSGLIAFVYNVSCSN